MEVAGRGAVNGGENMTISENARDIWIVAG
jgi:hypothetical protein